MNIILVHFKRGDMQIAQTQQSSMRSNSSLVCVDVRSVMWEQQIRLHTGNRILKVYKKTHMIDEAVRFK